ncbi:DUF5060 domain-containing protein [Paenibacillus koleovorans]|uniref:DUF5060 domain-containing protein n=1 Tax=Paenibacillus koleovorans TaxID=121608 RepID=UPI000FD9A22F|nr:DUF5060 domain-containing protein [Paenibacillus koleovorans]
MLNVNAIQYQVAEWSYRSRSIYEDPFHDLDLDAVITDEQGQTWTVPAYWAGGNEWKVRFSPPSEGRYRICTNCSDASNRELHGVEGVLEASSQTESTNRLLRHGPIRVGDSGRHFEHEDGTPFLWLADTWYTCLSRRMTYPGRLEELVEDRAGKGFSVVEIGIGLGPETPAFDERDENEAGYCWEERFARIRPAYFDEADRKIQYFVESGLAPCIVGAWGYYLLWMGTERMKRHWRYLIARYGAYPVFWCLAGECNMPFYGTRQPQRGLDKSLLLREWTQVAAYIRQTDPFRRPLTAHSNAFHSSRSQLEDGSLLDFELPQAGHGDTGRYNELHLAARHYIDIIQAQPTVPVISAEAFYEGIMGRNYADVQRFLFWSSLLSGSAGHTYGTIAVAVSNIENEPFGTHPSGTRWDDLIWEQAIHLPGAAHVGAGKRILGRFEWWRLEPSQFRIEPAAGPSEAFNPYCAWIPGETILIYTPILLTPWNDPVRLMGLEHGILYRAQFIDPRNGRSYPIGDVCADEQGEWTLPVPPIMQDWVVVLDLQPQIA